MDNRAFHDRFPEWFATGVVVLAVVLVTAVNYLGPYTLPDDIDSQISLLQEADLPDRAHLLWQEKLAAEPDNIDVHYGFLQNYILLPKEFDSETMEEEDIVRNDQELLAYYETLASEPSTADVAHYSMGLLHSFNEEYPRALKSFEKVQNESLPYLNNSLGFLWVKFENDEQAELYFQRELALEGGNWGGALSNLSELYLRTNQLDKLQELTADEVYGAYIGNGVRQTLAFRQGEIGTMLGFVFSVGWGQITGIGFWSAILICVVWLIYFWRIDVFEQEPISHLLVALAFGIFSVYLTLFLTDVVDLLSPLVDGEVWWSDWLYMIFHVGMVEEFAKISMAFIFMLLFRSSVNEPIDILIYGSVVALGFATLENILYFSSYGAGIVYGRFVMSTVGHMIDTCMICYAWVYTRHIRPSKKVWVIVPATFLLVSGLHGTYNFFLSGFDGSLALLSLAIMFVTADIYGNMLNNALNYSPHYQQDLAKSGRLNNYVIFVSVAIVILLIIYLYNTFRYSTELANGPLQPVTFFVVVLFILVFSTLLELTVVKNKLFMLFDGNESYREMRRQAKETAKEG